MQGLARLKIQYAGHEILEDGESLQVRFDLSTSDRRPLGTIPVTVGADMAHGLADQVANAHRLLSQSLAAWSQELEQIATHLKEASVTNSD